MRQRTWPTFAKIKQWALSVAAHSRGDTGFGGGHFFERGPGAQWRGSVEVPAMCTAEALEFRAFLHGLRGRSGTFYLPVPSRAGVSGVTGALGSSSDDTCPLRVDGQAIFSDCTDFTDGTQFSDTWASVGTVPAGETIPVTVTAGIVAGDFIVVTGQLMRVVAISGGNLTVRPRLRNATANGTTFAAGAVSGEFRILTDTPMVPLIPGRSREVQLDVEEAY